MGETQQQMESECNGLWSLLATKDLVPASYEGLSPC